MKYIQTLKTLIAAATAEACMTAVYKFMGCHVIQLEVKLPIVYHCMMAAEDMP